MSFEVPHCARSTRWPHPMGMLPRFSVWRRGARPADAWCGGDRRNRRARRRPRPRGAEICQDLRTVETAAAQETAVLETHRFLRAPTQETRTQTHTPRASHFRATNFLCAPPRLESGGRRLMRLGPRRSRTLPRRRTWAEAHAWAPRHAESPRSLRRCADPRGVSRKKRYSATARGISAACGGGTNEG